MQPLISVIMPSYNAEATIEKALKSIRMQTIPAEQIEILVIDGGSTDATCEIARKYRARVIENPHRLPEPAKLIGLENARGRYAMWQDTDEVLINTHQLENRMAFFSTYPEVHCMVCDDQKPGANCGIAAQYLCACGDPFTQFVYRRRGGVIATFSYVIQQYETKGCLLRFEQGDLSPIGDGGTTIFDLEWVKAQFPDRWKQLDFACSITAHICAETGCCGCIPGDDIIHYARASFLVYLSKLRFRVINNIFSPKESGYSARTQSKAAAKLSERKYWFVIYALTIIGPLWDSVRLAVKYHDVTMLLHGFYVYYVCTCIAINLGKKLMGRQAKSQSYG